MKLRICKIGLIAVTAIITTLQTQAQDFGDIFTAPGGQVEKYMEGYMRPGMISFANGLGGGWYNTAKPHKTLGFDLTFTINNAIIPNDQKMFTFIDDDYDNLTSTGLVGGRRKLPTIVGGKTDAQLSTVGTFNDPGNNNQYTFNGDPFDAPEGFDASKLPVTAIPVPAFQLGIGVIKNTDLKIRFGAANAEGFQMNMFGVGAMHDFKQWIPGIKHIPIDLAVFTGYSQLKSSYDIEESADYGGPGKVEMFASSFSYQVLVSKKLLFFTPYAGLGMNHTKSTVKVNGDFESEAQVGGTLVIKDPVDLDFGGGSSIKATIGGRLQFAIVTFHLDYSIQEYNMLTAGFGFTVR